MKPRWRTIALFLAILLIALAILFDRTWRFGEVFSPADLLQVYYPWSYDQPRRDPTNPTRSDEAFYHYPLVLTHWDRIRHGDFPQWDPLVLSGTPAFHQGLDVGRAFSPLSVPFYLLPPDLATTAYAPLRLLCAGLLMWLYLAHAGFSPPARAAGALAFAFNGAFIVWLSAPMPTVALWLPLLALAAERACMNRTPRDAALLALAIGLQFLGAYLPTSLVVMSVTAAWAAGWLWRGPGAAASVAPGQRTRSRALLLLAGAAVGGALLAAIGLWPMLATLFGSPASQRSMRPFTLPLANAVTFAIPNFWGTPLLGNWWYPGPGNYPEMVTYLGVVTLALASVGLAVTVRQRDRRGWLALIVALFALMQMYGLPPVSWTSALPGFRQMNPYRWNVAVAFAVSMLAGLGVDGFARDRERRRCLLVASGMVCVATLIAIAMAVVWTRLPAIRQLGLQPFERTQFSRFLVIATGALVLLGLSSVRSPHVSRATAWLLAFGVAADLLYAGHGFNPTIARNRLYPSAEGIERARAELRQGRIAPIGPSNQLVEGHVWGLYGLPAITGFDFYGDSEYQRFVRRASGLPPREARWDYVGIPRDASPDLRLLGLLGTTVLVTPPTDVVTEAGAYRDVGELTPGRLVHQSFVARQNGLRRVELTAGTYYRQNEGSLEVILRLDENGRVIHRQGLPSAGLRNLDWIRVDLPEQADSKNRRYSIEVSGRAPGGRAPTLLATHERLPGGQLTVDGTPAEGALWMRTYASAPDRFPGAELLYARDLNLYRNPAARPPAWFVETTVALSADRHLSEISKGGFDPARVAIVDMGKPDVQAAPVADRAPQTSELGLGKVVSRGPEAGRRAQTPFPRVLAWGQETPDRLTYRVSAPAGGWLVFRERFHPGWSLHSGLDALALVRADSVLMSAWIPPGTTDLILEFTSPEWSWARGLSIAGLLGIVIALLSRD